MVVLESLAAVRDAPLDEVGSKARSLADMAARGFAVPHAACVPCACYEAYLQATGLGNLIVFELGRKRMDDMRWEEVWDAALRIRNRFLATPLPDNLDTALRGPLERLFGRSPSVVRSSAPGEDSTDSSFAGLHESFVNIRGVEEMLKHVRLVWASLWSDAAILYRRELGLDVRRSRMAVLIQHMAVGEVSGVAFSRSPSEATQALVEAVHGLNAGLVDGTVEPDRWAVDRARGTVVEHYAPSRQEAMRAGVSGIGLIPLDPGVAARPPLVPADVTRVFELSQRAEDSFGSPQDVEWTLCGEELRVLQSRPITTLATAEGGDKRAWYRSLSRSFENLKQLRHRVESEIVPGMQADARRLAETDLSALDDKALDREVEQREQIYQHWVDAYWEDCIPFAHGVRLFGQYYNDLIAPQDPYEFVELLGQTEMRSVARNRELATLAERVRDNSPVREALAAGDPAALPAEFKRALESFVERNAELVGARRDAALHAVGPLLLEMASRSTTPPAAHRDGSALRHAFFDRVPAAQRGEAEEKLELARASHRWRDDDNLYLHEVEVQVLRAQEERRHRQGGAPSETPGGRDMRFQESGEPFPHDRNGRGEGPVSEPVPVRARQLVGQPAGPGMATGVAHVVEGQEELLQFKRGEILVCDALSPTMTFVIPMAGAIVERRGGMLIHGAIIAREYGIPCVTGVPRATELIATGARLTVDGYLGLVRVNASSDVASRGDGA